MVHFNVYSELSNPYVQIVNYRNSKVWDDANSTMSASPTYADTAMALTVNSYFNGFPVTIPASLPSGKYDVLVKDNATPATADNAVAVYRIQWANGQALGVAGRLECPVIEMRVI